MFYVYELVDPRDGATFYVGKGKAQRAWQHERDARQGRISNAMKHERIAGIIADGSSVVVKLVAEYEDETEAFDHEAELIASLTGLTNILARGGGWALSLEEAQRRLDERSAKKVALNAARSWNWLKEWLAKVDGWPNGVTFPNLHDGDAKAAEFVALVRGMLAENA
jgi:hypothetical protein